MNVTVNIVELASELAHADLELHMSHGAMYKDDGSVITYTEEAQDEFNELYDKYYSIVESCRIDN
jgi:hypothetical protein